MGAINTTDFPQYGKVAQKEAQQVDNNENKKEE